ncbi:MAG: thioredoxin domain-containing protein [Opitutae bacterium]|nr:thioredoxin domain-containing protein [Opitutae bacterium]
MPNRLAAERSPYLLQHADNPVDWLPWGEEAFAQARAEQKPIFLSIGYSTCHWCHVMAHESFENPAVAAVLNRDFVPVKLDREERPDLDRVYMAYVQQTTGHGGWPMSVWLTPDLKPFFGGTYFPPGDRHGRPGFVTVLNAITRHWREQREKILAGADEVVAALRSRSRGTVEGPAREVAGQPAPAETLPEAASEALTKAFQYFHEAHDSTWGGFGGAPKFPRPSTLNFLFRMAALQGRKTAIGVEMAKMAVFTLRKMAEGGLQDHVGGGFHRYSVDEQWFVSHFEKMLYDQAQLAVSYLEARQATGVEAYAWVARDIFTYVRRDLTHPAGGFYSAEDADSLLAETVGRVVPDEPQAEHGSSGGFALPHKTHAEGAFYVWTKDEIDAVLGADAAFFCARYGVKPGGNVEHDPQGEFKGKNVLMQRQSLAATARDHGLDAPAAGEKLLGCLEKLRAVRARRSRPHLDDKVITAWNGLMISALARGAQVLGDRAYLAAATRAAEFIRRELCDEAGGALYRSWRGQRSGVAGFAEDYAFLIQGLLDLYEAGFEIRWLQWAERLQAAMDAQFGDPARGGYFNSRADDPHVIVRLKEDHDGAEPSANSVAALNLLRLDWMTGLPGARDRAVKTIEALRPQWTAMPQGLPQLLCAIELVVDAPRTVVLAGDPAAADFQALAAVVHEQPGPRRALLCADGGAGQQWLAARRPYLAEMKPLGGRATAYVCENFTCRAPVTSPAALRAELGFSGK